MLKWFLEIGLRTPRQWHININYYAELFSILSHCASVSFSMFAENYSQPNDNTGSR